MNTTAAPATPPELSPQDKVDLAEFVTYMKECGFCKIDDSTSNQTRLFNRFTGEKFFPSMLEGKFDDWCAANDKTTSYPGPRYIMRTLIHVVGHRFDPNGSVYSTMLSIVGSSSTI